MNKKLLRSVREYKKQSVLAPILVILEVLMEVLIPLEMAKIIDVGIANGDMSYIIQRGVILVAMAMLSLFFGVQAGNMAAGCYVQAAEEELAKKNEADILVGNNKKKDIAQILEEYFAAKEPEQEVREMYCY